MVRTDNSGPDYFTIHNWDNLTVPVPFVSQFGRLNGVFIFIFRFKVSIFKRVFSEIHLKKTISLT